MQVVDLTGAGRKRKRKTPSAYAQNSKRAKNREPSDAELEDLCSEARRTPPLTRSAARIRDGRSPLPTRKQRQKQEHEGDTNTKSELKAKKKTPKSKPNVQPQVLEESTGPTIDDVQHRKIKSVVQDLKRKHPEWALRQLLEEVVQTRKFDVAIGAIDTMAQLRMMTPGEAKARRKDKKQANHDRIAKRKAQRQERKKERGLKEGKQRTKKRSKKDKAHDKEAASGANIVQTNAPPKQDDIVVNGTGDKGTVVRESNDELGTEEHELHPSPPPVAVPQPEPVHYLNREITAGTNNLKLHELALEEQHSQRSYFGIVDPDALVICLTCGASGHSSAICAARTCQHCSARDVHLSQACPQHRKCARCRQRGHDNHQCQNRTKILSNIEDACDICQIIGHVEEKCPHLGRRFRPQASTTKRIPREAMVVACSRCGASTHWGDDCYVVDPRLQIASLRDWSQDYAELFILHDSQPDDQSHLSTNDDVLDGGDAPPALTT